MAAKKKSGNSSRSSYSRTGSGRSSSRSSTSSRSRSNSSAQSQTLDGKSLLALAAFIIAIVALVLVLREVGKDEGAGPDVYIDPASTISQEDSLTSFIEPDTESETESDVVSEENSSSEESSSSQAPAYDYSGTYQRTLVAKEDASKLVLSNPTADGFDFTLQLYSVNISGTARYSSGKKAKYSSNGATISFEFSSGKVTLTQSGEVGNLGLSSSKSVDGQYITGVVSYLEDVAAQSPYVKDLRKSTMITSALKSTLTADDYEFVKRLFDKGNTPVYSGSELDYDKDGNEINVDRELDAIKYYAFINGEGETILICTNDGKIYCGVSDLMDMRYYTNDSSRKDNPPVSIKNTAIAKGLQLVNMN